MADHVGVGVVDDDEVERVRLELVDELVGDADGAHLRLVVVGRHVAGAGHEDALLPRDRLLDAAVEEERDVRVLLGLGDVQLPQAVLGEDVGEHVLGMVRRERDRQRELLLVLRHGDEVDGRRVGAAVELGEAVLGEGARELAGAVRAEVEEEADVAVAHARVVLGRDDRRPHELVVLAAGVGGVDRGLGVGGEEALGRRRARRRRA